MVILTTLLSMRYLGKRKDSKVIQAAWRYEITKHRPQIRHELLNEQKGFCAYSERYVDPMDACDVEHFDPRKKGTTVDDYWNWYAVHHNVNMSKPRKIENYLPILCPYSDDVSRRIHYAYGQFEPVDPGDQEAKNLIDFLGLNHPNVAESRARHIKRTKADRERFFKDDLPGFIEHLQTEITNLSYITALEAEFGINLTVS